MFASVADRLRTLIRDWYESYRKALEKDAREARNIHRQQKGVQPSAQQEEGERPPHELPSIDGDLSLSLLPGKLSLIFPLQCSRNAQ